jgi:hypothetical protein
MMKCRRFHFLQVQLHFLLQVLRLLQNPNPVLLNHM